MRQVLALGLPQAVLPPLARPEVHFLRQAGFRGSDTDVFAQAAASAPYLVRLAMSSAFMWAANVATVIPSSDSTDGRCHIMVANLVATPHLPLKVQRGQRCYDSSGAIPLVVVHDPPQSA
jgi:succinylarginine dihydrolase